ncbi:unnamed protein product [Aureobasidium vineae]|uniref:Uncharacterized protein n=1 Tax=Aureobasidium vineae TaxID=2773715 RepID=A0A9N8JKE3_9PEZI|nr:unnamed protein product [Aureobasidium vineae]
MPPRKGKAAPKGKAKKEPQAEPATNGDVEKVEETAAPAEEAPAAEEPKIEEPVVEETKTEEPTTEPATTTEGSKADEPTADAPLEAEPTVDAEPAAASKETKPKKRKGAAEAAIEPAASESKSEEKKASKKRKVDIPVPRPGERKSGRGAQKAAPTTEQLLNYLLSPASTELCRPDDESAEVESKGADFKTYSSSALTAFEELVCAVVLSRPISHKLGLRAIRTILNAPYSFTTPSAIISAGKEKRHQALDDAKTQHKDKTAEQIGLVADVVSHKFSKNDSDTSLDKLREQASKGWDMERDLLQENIKGVGKTGLDIFFRRVQWLWPEAYPFVDERSSRGIEKLGLPKHPDELAKVLDRYWAKLDTSNLAKGDRDMQKRRAFVVICERATSADLEGKSDAILEAAASS